MLKVYVERNDTATCTMFVEEGWEITNNIFTADLLALKGGPDVTPELYGEHNEGMSQNVPERDVVTFGLIHIARDFLGLPIVGICRGSQAISVANGGSLKQHIDNHCRYHTLTVDDVVYEVSSSHHQEAIPDLPEQLIHRADDGTVEIHIYPHTKMLGFQPHPEWHPKGHDCRNLFFSQLKKLDRRFG